MREETIQIYKFEELEENVKEKVLEKYWDVNVDYEWWEWVFGDAERIGLKIEEFDIGRGAYVKGKWFEDAEEAAKKILEEYGEGCETYQDALAFKNELVQARKRFEGQEDYDTEFVEFEESYEYKETCNEFLKTICEDYRIILEKEYEYLTSEEVIKETIEANEWEFTEDGKIYRKVVKWK